MLTLNVGTNPDSAVKTSPLQNKAAPAFDLPTLDGTRITDADLQGKWTVINFWNTWCVPCQQELPELKKFVKAHAGDDTVQTVGIVRDPRSRRPSSRSTRRRRGWTGPSRSIPAARPRSTRDTGRPETFLVAPNGEVLVYFYGPVTQRVLDQALAAAGGPTS